MANTLTALEPTLFTAAQQVSNEAFGVIDAVSADFNDQGVAIGDAVTVPIAPSRAASDFVPGVNTVQGADATAEDVKVQITKSRKVSWHLTGEQIRSLDNGATSAEWIRQLIAQGMRTLRNEAEADCANAIKVGASRATGTAGTNPFSSNINAMVDLRKILRDNGAPLADMSLCFNSTSEAALQKLAIIQQADQAGSPEERRSGNLNRQFGFALRTSAGLELHTAGTGASYLTNGVTAEGARNIAVDTGTGTILDGDVVTIAGTQYVVNNGLDTGVIKIGRPGALAEISDNTAVALAADYTPILGFERSAVAAVMRPPIIPMNPTIQQLPISDQEGMTYLLLDIAQYGQRTWELHLAWGFKVVQGEHVAILLS